MRILLSPAVALILLTFIAVDTSAEPNRWEASIERFEAADAEAKPPRDAALFVGSSSIVFWAGLADDMQPLPVINRGFGGSTMRDLNHFRDRIVAPYAPKLVVVYEGDNDIGVGRSPEVILAEFDDFIAYVRATLPDADICFLAIKPSLARAHLWSTMATTNRALEARAASADDLCYIDIATPMLKDDGTAEPSLFVDDGLHMNEKGYAIWARAVRPVVEARLAD